MLKISPSNECSGLISFRIDWLDLLAVQGRLKSLLQHHSSKSSILRHSAFFVVQLSHPYMITGKTLAMTIQKAIPLTMLLGHSHWPLFNGESLPPATLLHFYFLQASPVPSKWQISPVLIKNSLTMTISYTMALGGTHF